MSDDRSHIGPALAAAEAAGTLSELTDALRELHLALGNRTYRVIEKESIRLRAAGELDASVSHSTISEYLKPANPRPLTYPFLRRFGRSCGAIDAEVRVFEQAWLRIARAPGPVAADDHRSTLRRMAEIADTITAEAGLTVARDLYQHVYDAYARLGIRDERIVHDLAVTLSRLDDFEGARPLLQEVLRACQAEHGPADPLTCEVREELAVVHLTLGDTAEAARLAAENQSVDPGRPQTLAILAELSGD